MWVLICYVFFCRWTEGGGRVRTGVCPRCEGDGHALISFSLYFLTYFLTFFSRYSLLRFYSDFISFFFLFLCFDLPYIHQPPFFRLNYTAFTRPFGLSVLIHGYYLLLVSWSQSVCFSSRTPPPYISIQKKGREEKGKDGGRRRI